MRKLIRLWSYFKRGHTNYLVYTISFINFITITYTLLFVAVLGFPSKPEYMAVYAVCYLALYILLAILIGRWDYRRGSVPIETELVARASPWVKDMAQALTYIAMGENEKAVEILKKWIGEE